MPHLDPRCVRSREKILAAAAELLEEHGFDEVSIEAIAARSGVAKTTIYRHFDTREELCLQAIESLVDCPELVDSGDLVADIRSSLTELSRTLRGGVGQLMSSVLGAADRCPEIGALMRDLSTRRRAALLRRLRAAQAAGHLPIDVDVEALASVIIGPLFFRRYVSRQSIGPAFVASLIDTALVPHVRARPAVTV